MALKDLLGKTSKSSATVSLVPYLDNTKVSKTFTWRTLAVKAKRIYDHLVSNKDSPNYEEDFWLYFTEFFETVHGEKIRNSGEKKLYPSGLRNECRRKTWYNFKDAPVTNPDNTFVTPRLQRIFDVGHFWHNYLQMRLKAAGVLIQSEVPVRSDEMLIRGRADGIIELLKKLHVLEIKTMSGYQFQNLKAPLDDHIFQANLYAGMLKIDSICFLYINKDTAEFKEFYIDFSPKYYKEALTIINEVKESLKLRTPPERLCSKSSSKTAMECIYCNHCFKNS